MKNRINKIGLYEEYERRKRDIDTIDPDEYEAECKKIAKELGI